MLQGIFLASEKWLTFDQVVQYPTGQRGKPDLRPEDDRWRTGGGRFFFIDRVLKHVSQLEILFIRVFGSTCSRFGSCSFWFLTWTACNICNMGRVTSNNINIFKNTIWTYLNTIFPSCASQYLTQHVDFYLSTHVEALWVASLLCPMKPGRKGSRDRCRATKRKRPAETGPFASNGVDLIQIFGVTTGWYCLKLYWIVVLNDC